jgi:hypothetical protein
MESDCTVPYLQYPAIGLYAEPVGYKSWNSSLWTYSFLHFPITSPPV